MLSENESIRVKDLIDVYYKTLGFPKLADRFIKQPEAIAELVDVATLDEKYPYPQQASWLLLHVARKDKSLVEPYTNQLIDCILTTKNQSVLRNLLGVSLCLPITDYEQGRLVERLFNLINDPDNKPGVVCYAIRKLVDFLEWYPELRHELELILEFREETNVTPGILVWTKKILKKKLPDRR
jgi:hypothetical protein